MLRLPVAVLILAAGVLVAGAAVAEDVPPPPALGPATPVPSTQLRVEVVIARYEGERQVASIPNSFLLAAYPRDTPAGKHPKSELKMGVEVPIPVTTFAAASGEKGGTLAPPTSFQYRNVGTNIECRAREIGSGRFEIVLWLDSSTVYAGADAERAAYEGQGARTMFRTFNVTLRPLLRDGESVETVASADPVTGEVVKVNVSMEVVK
ncbi:MAG: hypothetical protein PVJ73_00590 [Acidobacteriota bacterium]|jgi:hypothetical protein